MKKSLIEALKEGGRLLLLAVVSYVLTEGLIDLAIEYFIGAKIDLTTKAQLVGLLTTALRAVDKYLHELGKENGSELLSAGLTRF